MKKIQHDNKHMTIDERIIIQTGIENGSSKAGIASVIRKDPFSVAKEIRKHRTKKPRNTFNRPCICVHARACGRKCIGSFERYEEPKCRRRDISSGACNKCEKFSRCYLDRYIYNAQQADKEYRETLSGSREGINISSKEMIGIACGL